MKEAARQPKNLTEEFGEINKILNAEHQRLGAREGSEEHLRIAVFNEVFKLALEVDKNLQAFSPEHLSHMKGMISGYKTSCERIVTHNSAIPKPLFTMSLDIGSIKSTDPETVLKAINYIQQELNNI